MNRIVQTTVTMFAIIRAERRDLMIPSSFAILTAIVADRVMLWLVSLPAPATAASLREWCPAIRPAAVGLLCGGALIAFCFRPFWIQAWKRTRAPRP